MFSRCNRVCPIFVLAFAASAFAEGRVLRVCSDPNNLPLSNQAGEGFENRIAELLAHHLNARLEYTWWPQRKSFLRQSLDAHRCDLVIGMPSASDDILASQPYYRSTYVFVSRHDRHLGVASLSDPRLSGWRIGIHLVGDNYAPPGYALAMGGLSANLIGFSLFGKDGEPNPAAKLVDAVAHGDVDIGIAWGPLAGYFAQRAKTQLDLVPVSPSTFMGVPFTYEISVGVRKDDHELKREVDDILNHQCAAVQQVLAQYGAPQPEGGKPLCDGSLSLRSASPR